MIRQTILILIIFNCGAIIFAQHKNDRVNILGYSIGETINSNDFYYEHRMDSAILVGDYIKDDRLHIFTWFDIIVTILYSSNGQIELDSIIKMINTTIDKKPIISDSELIDNGYEYSWDDSIYKDEIKIYSNDKIDSTKFSITIYNHDFTDKLVTKIDDSFDLKIIQYDD